MESPVSLSAVLLRHAPFPQDLLETLEQSVREVRIPKGGFFLREGEGPGRVALVRRGIFRLFYTEEDGTEATRAFIAEGGFLLARVSFLRGDAAPYTIEALEESELAVFPEGDPRVQAPWGPLWYQFLLSLATERLDTKDRRIKGFLTLDAAGRYRDFLDEFPGIEARVRQHHIASYLGLTPVSLSRIRRRVHGD